MLLFIYTNMAAPVESFKDYLVKGLASLVVGMMWYDIKDIKTQLHDLNDRTVTNTIKIENIERQFYKQVTLKSPFPPGEYPKGTLKTEMVAVLRDNDLTPKDYETFN
jgi:hypothetical protein